MGNTTILRNDNILELSDGRRLSYAEYGDPDGQPVFLVHGTPGSRLYWKSFPGFPFRSDLHLIAPDRPGYGLSAWKPGRTLTDWPDDVVLHHALPWGFPLEQIKVKVYLWQGENDTSVPNSQARYLAEMLPNCDAMFIPNAGHLWHIDHMAEVLDTLVGQTEYDPDNGAESLRSALCRVYPDATATVPVKAAIN